MDDMRRDFISNLWKYLLETEKLSLYLLAMKFYYLAVIRSQTGRGKVK